MAQTEQNLTLRAGLWYAWEMLPGYLDTWYGSRYYSPIRIEQVTPRKTGGNRLFLEFYNAAYAEGVRDFAMDVKIVLRRPGYLVCDLLDDERCAIITNVTTEWVRLHFPNCGLASSISNGDLQAFLTREF